MAFTTEVETDDGAVEIDIEEHVPDGHRIVSEDEVVDRDYHESEIERIKNRFDSSMREDVRQELRQDEDFREEVAAEVGMDEEERKKIVQRVEEEKVQPLQEELRTWKQQTKREKILNAAQSRDDIDPKALQSVGSAEPLVMQALEDRVTETDDGRFVMTDENGDPLPGSDGGYASIQEGLDRLADEESYDALFTEPEPASGTGFESSGTASKSAEDWQDWSRDEVMDYVHEHGNHPRLDA